LLERQLLKPLFRPIFRVLAGIVPVTSGMTLTASWTVRGDAYTELASSTSASVRVDATIDNSNDGILMEAGATGAGLILYVYSGVLYFQCGSGSSFGTSSDRAETSYTLPIGQDNYIVEWSANADNAVLYVNGAIVDSQTYSNTLIAGSDAGTVGQVNSVSPVNRGGWTSNGQGNFPNTITKCDIFLNQVTVAV
jgi:hypothetical protein